MRNGSLERFSGTVLWFALVLGHVDVAQFVAALVVVQLVGAQLGRVDVAQLGRAGDQLGPIPGTRALYRQAAHQRRESL